MAGGSRGYNRRAMDAREEQRRLHRGWSPSTRIRSVVRPPCSKSQALRVLLAASLAEGETRVLGLSEAEDVEAALASVEALGALSVRHDSGLVTIARQRETLDSEVRRFDAGESGTLARFLTAVLALTPPAGARSRIEGRGTLARRSSPALLATLREAGAGLVERGASGSWPLELTCAAPPEHLALARPTSSQEVSALLLALCTSGREHVLAVRGPIPSRPYLDMTLRILGTFGAEVIEDESQEGTFQVRGPLRAPLAPVQLEPDASAAAVALAAACLAGGQTEVLGFGDSPLQGDVAIVSSLSAFGCSASLKAGRLRASGRPGHGAELDLGSTPDLAPVLAAVAGAVALAGGDHARSRLTGLETLQGKESARVSVLAGALEALGLSVRASNDALEVAPGRPTSAPLVLDPQGDHRMAFAFALLGLVRPGLTVRDPLCVSKSWPEFWDACVQPSHPENRAQA